MAILTFNNDAEGRAQAAAVAYPKHTWENSRRIVVFTGSDMPTDEATSNPAGIVVNNYQIRDAILTVGGQTRLDQWAAMLAAPPTPRIGLYLSFAQEITRGNSKVNQARLQLAGVSAHWTAAQLDAYFIAASALGR